MDEWCRIVKVDGRQVLFQKMYDTEEEDYRIKMTLQAADWVRDAPFASVVISIDKNNKPFPLKQFDMLASEKAAKKLIYEEILPLVKAQCEK